MSVKWSAFPSGTTIAGTDITVGLQGGLNVQWTWSQVKTYITGGGTLAITSGKTLTVSNTLTLTGTDGSSVAFGAGGTVPYLGTANTWTAQNTFAAGTITTSQPLTVTQTWNAGGVTFTGLLANVTDTASASASLLMDLQVAGSSKFNVKKSGFATLGGADQGSTVAGGLYTSLGGVIGTQLGWNATGTIASISGGQIGWVASASDARGAPDTILTRAAVATLQHGAADAASPVAQTIQFQSVVAGTTNTAGVDATLNLSAGTGTGAGGKLAIYGAPAGSTGTSQNSRIRVADFNTAGLLNGKNEFALFSAFTDVSNFDGLLFSYNNGASQWDVMTHQLGTGSSRNLRLGTKGASALVINTNNNDRWNFTSNGHFLANSDNSYDIGASAATRPRTGYFGTSLVAPVVKVTTALVTTTDGASTASFTANMVGSTGGPTTAAQNGWQKFQDSTGATVWVPVWK